jgi:hypothetical protein
MKPLGEEFTNTDGLIFSVSLNVIACIAPSEENPINHTKIFLTTGPDEWWLVDEPYASVKAKVFLP